MWVYSIFPPNLSLIGPLTMEIYYKTGIAGTDTQTDTHTLKLILSGGVKKEGRIIQSTPSAHLLSLYLSLSLSPLVSLALSAFHLLPIWALLVGRSRMCRHSWIILFVYLFLLW